MNAIKGFAIAGLLAGAITTCADTGGLLPKGTNLHSLTVINENQLGNSAQGVMISTLQGIVARRSTSQIFIVGSAAGYNVWPNYLKSTYGVSLATNSNPWSVLEQFKNFADGYVLYDAAANSNSLNVATSLCGPLNAIAVDSTIEATARSHGVTNRLLDVRTRDEAWAWTNYNSLFSRSVVVEQKESFSANLRDYATMAGAFTFYDGNSPFRTFVMSQMAADAACLGWGDGEQIPVGDCSSNGVYTVGSDWALSLSTLSSVRDDALYQRTHSLPPSHVETNVHYVTFVTTDGDNVQWNVGDLVAYFNHPARGKFNMGWSISPSLADLAPSVLRWYFDNSSNGLNRDFFTVGTSGSGYFYPSMYPPTELDLHVQKLNSLMDRADLDIVHINDFGSFGRLDLWNKYLAQPNINALFYLEYSLYNATGGAVLFSSNGKPVIGARDLLWAGVEEETNVIARINSYPRDPSSYTGYTLVEVHVWTKNLGSVQNVVTNLLPDVRVVTPDLFANLIRNNIGRKLSFDFDSSAQNWFAQTAGGAADQALWSSTAGNSKGALVLNGSDFGKTNSTPNAFFARQIILPVNATDLTFQTRADNDGLLCVQIRGTNGSLATLLDWEKLAATNVWQTRSTSLTNYAGQTVTLYFEQNDGGQSSSKARYLDNITISTSGAPTYIPVAPKLLSLTATNSVTLFWRDNDGNESGFKIERCVGTNSDWIEIADVSTNLTSYADLTAIGGTHYSYRLRSWNGAGFSAYSNIRSIVSPARPPLTAVLTGNSIELNWPLWATNFTLCSTTNLTTPWLIVHEPPITIDSTCHLSLPLTSDNRFFRLSSH